MEKLVSLDCLLEAIVLPPFGIHVQILRKTIRWKYRTAWYSYL